MFHSSPIEISSTPANTTCLVSQIPPPGTGQQVETRLKEIIAETALEYQADLIELEVMPDRVHLLVEVDPQYGIHRRVKQMKGRISRLLRQEFPTLKSRLSSLWTNSYYVSTVGGAPLEIIKQYIENQKRV